MKHAKVTKSPASPVLDELTVECVQVVSSQVAGAAVVKGRVSEVALEVSDALFVGALGDETTYRLLDGPRLRDTMTI